MVLTIPENDSLGCQTHSSVRSGPSDLSGSGAAWVPWAIISVRNEKKNTLGSHTLGIKVWLQKASLRKGWGHTWYEGRPSQGVEQTHLGGGKKAVKQRWGLGGTLGIKVGRRGEGVGGGRSRKVKGIQPYQDSHVYLLVYE